MAETKITQNELSQPNWVNLTLLAGWATYDINNYPTAQYYKDAAGIVHLRGLIKDGTVTAGTTIASGIPVGSRISKRQHYACISANAFAGIRVNEDGTLTILAGTSSWLDLATIHYRADS